MKKTYIIPQVEIHAVNVEGLIATSPLNVANSGDTADLKGGSATKDADGLVKGGNSYDVWDDDWNR